MKNLLKLSLAALLALSLNCCDSDNDNNKDNGSTRPETNNQGNNNQGNNNQGTNQGTNKTDPSDPLYCGTNGERKCNSNNTRPLICQNNTWTAADVCENGCENGSCKDASADPLACSTNGSKKCNGTNTGILVCTNKQWTAGETCANGCENGKCKSSSSTNPPVEDDGSYCVGDVLHYLTTSGTEKTIDCASYNDGDVNGFVCDKLADGTSDCVYSASFMASDCSSDGQVVDLQCFEDEGVQILGSVSCVKNSAGKLVGLEDYGYSKCTTYEGKTVAAVCSDEGEVKGYQCNACTDDYDHYWAVCDGSAVAPTGVSTERYVDCDTVGCKDTSSKQACSAVCKSEGSDVCYVDTEEGGYYCEEPSSSRYVDCDEYGCQETDSKKACSAVCQEKTGSAACYVDVEAKKFACGEMPSGDAVCTDDETACLNGAGASQTIDISAFSLCDATALASCKSQYPNESNVSCVYSSTTKSSMCTNTCTGNESYTICSETNALQMTLTCETIGGTKVIVPSAGAYCK